MTDALLVSIVIIVTTILTMVVMVAIATTLVVKLAFKHTQTPGPTGSSSTKVDAELHSSKHKTSDLSSEKFKGE